MILTSLNIQVYLINPGYVENTGSRKYSTVGAFDLLEVSGRMDIVKAGDICSMNSSPFAIWWCSNPQTKQTTEAE